MRQDPRNIEYNEKKKVFFFTRNLFTINILLEMHQITIYIHFVEKQHLLLFGVCFIIIYVIKYLILDA
jgi:hypothetical protein